MTSPERTPPEPDAEILPHASADEAGTSDEVAPVDAPAADPERTVVEERLHPLSPLVSMWIGVVAFGWFALTSILQGDSVFDDMSTLLQRVPWWLLAVMAAVVIGLAFGYWSWWTTKFIIDDVELRIENTGAFQESKRIAFSRIQSIDITQPFAARLLGLAELSIDVGADAPTKLSFLRRARAAELRDYLMVRAHGRTATALPAEPGATASAWDDLSAADEILIRLTPGEVILGAVASLELLGLLLAFGIPMGIAAALDAPALAIGTGFIPLAFALLGFLSSRLFGQFNYTLARTPAGVRISRGLFTLKSQTVPAHRVQAIRISQPLPWRWLNRARLDVSVLGLGSLGSDGESPTTTILLPIGRPQQVQTALASLWPGLRLDELTFTGPPRRARWLDPCAFPWLGYAADHQVVVSRLGWLNRSQHIVPHARMQSVSLNQGPIERRVGVANVALHTTNLLGGEKIIHIDADEARRFVFSQMDRARSSRTEELLDPPGLRAALAGRADAATDADLWTLRTHADTVPVAENPPRPPDAVPLDE